MEILSSTFSRVSVSVTAWRSLLKAFEEFLNGVAQGAGSRAWAMVKDLRGRMPGPPPTLGKTSSRVPVDHLPPEDDDPVGPLAHQRCMSWVAMTAVSLMPCLLQQTRISAGGDVGTAVGSSGGNAGWAMPMARTGPAHLAAGCRSPIPFGPGR